MAPPPPPSPSNSGKLDYYYFVIGLALVAIILLATNAIAVGCCSRIRGYFSWRGSPSRDRNVAEMRRWIPSVKYSKKEEVDGAQECAVCLSAFVEGEEVRRMPACQHAFHVDCIDMWLNSHSSCPVCRGSVLPTPTDSVDVSAQFHSQVNLILVGRAGEGGNV